MKTINLEEILNKALRNGGFSLDLISKPETLEAMREACNQTIDLCVENVTLVESAFTWGHEINEESILNTKSQII